MNSTSTIDKYIKISWQMILNDVVLGCGILVIMMVMVNAIGIGTLFMLAIAFFMLCKSAKKLLYTSLYGQGATMYQALPVSPEEVVLGKTTVLTGASLLYLVVLVLLGPGYSIISNWIVALKHGSDYYMTEHVAELVAEFMNIEYLNEFMIPYIFVVTILGLVTETFRIWLMVFFGIAWYNSLPLSKKTGLAKAAAVAAVVGVQMVTGTVLNSMTEMSGEVYFLPTEVVGIVLDIIIAVIIYRLTVKRVRSCDNIVWEVA